MKEPEQKTITLLGKTIPAPGLETLVVGIRPYWIEEALLASRVGLRHIALTERRSRETGLRRAARHTAEFLAAYGELLGELRTELAPEPITAGQKARLEARQTLPAEYGAADSLDAGLARLAGLAVELQAAGHAEQLSDDDHLGRAHALWLSFYPDQPGDWPLDLDVDACHEHGPN